MVGTNVQYIIHRRCANNLLTTQLVNVMSSKDKVWNTLKGHNPYNVPCRHNYWGGRYYEVGVRSVRVLAGTPEEATQFVINNLDLAEKHLRTLRTMRGGTSIRLIRKCEGYKLQERDILRATPIKGAISIKAFNQQGELVRYDK